MSCVNVMMKFVVLTSNKYQLGKDVYELIYKYAFEEMLFKIKILPNLNKAFLIDIFHYYFRNHPKLRTLGLNKVYNEFKSRNQIKTFRPRSQSNTQQIWIDYIQFTNIAIPTKYLKYYNNLVGKSKYRINESLKSKKEITNAIFTWKRKYFYYI